MDATAKLVAIIAVAAFATERILAAVNYLMNAVRLSRVRPRLVVRLRVRERRKLVLLVIAAAIALTVVDRANIRLLRVMQLNNVHPLVDFWMTWLVVLAGADRVRSMLAGSGGEGGASKGADASQGHSDPPAIRVVVDGEVRDLRRVS